jgi:hypothetical protein
VRIAAKPHYHMCNNSRRFTAALGGPRASRRVAKGARRAGRILPNRP